MRTTLDKIYNGAWNNLELSKSSKQALTNSRKKLKMSILTTCLKIIAGNCEVKKTRHCCRRN